MISTATIYLIILVQFETSMKGDDTEQSVNQTLLLMT